MSSNVYACPCIPADVPLPPADRQEKKKQQQDQQGSEGELPDAPLDRVLADLQLIYRAPQSQSDASEVRLDSRTVEKSDQSMPERLQRGSVVSPGWNGTRTPGAAPTAPATTARVQGLPSLPQEASVSITY